MNPLFLAQQDQMIEQLDDTLLIHVLSLIEVNQLFELRLLSKRFNELIISSQFYQRLIHFSQEQWNQPRARLKRIIIDSTLMFQGVNEIEFDHGLHPIFIDPYDSIYQTILQPVGFVELIETEDFAGSVTLELLDQGVVKTIQRLILKEDQGIKSVITINNNTSCQIHLQHQNSTMISEEMIDQSYQFQLLSQPDNLETITRTYEQFKWFRSQINNPINLLKRFRIRDNIIDLRSWNSLRLTSLKFRAKIEMLKPFSHKVKEILKEIPRDPLITRLENLFNNYIKKIIGQVIQPQDYEKIMQQQLVKFECFLGTMNIEHLINHLGLSDMIIDDSMSPPVAFDLAYLLTFTQVFDTSILPFDVYHHTWIQYMVSCFSETSQNWILSTPILTKHTASFDIFYVNQKLKRSTSVWDVYLVNIVKRIPLDPLLSDEVMRAMDKRTYFTILSFLAGDYCLKNQETEQFTVQLEYKQVIINLDYTQGTYQISHT